MNFADNSGTSIFWRERGRGAPLLMIQGLGYSSDMWHQIEDALAERYRVIVFDNRGIGRSPVVPGPHLMSTMASDAAAVLDAAGVETANVMGISMGGYIAQEFALMFPDRVESLILGCTGCGGAEAVLAAPEVLGILRARATMPAEQGIRAIVPYVYDPGTPPERIEADLAIRLRTYPAEATYTAQLAGISQWGSYQRLGGITAHTLVIHGEHDQLVPPSNGELLAAAIPGAHLVKMRDASHIFFSDQPELTVSTISEFLG